MVQAVTDSNYKTETDTGVTLTDFWATWCGPCRMQSPVIDKLAESRDDVKFVKMDVDANPETPKSFGIMAIPTLVIKKMARLLRSLLAIKPRISWSQP